MLDNDYSKMQENFNMLVTHLSGTFQIASQQTSLPLLFDEVAIKYFWPSLYTTQKPQLLAVLITLAIYDT